PIFPFTFILYQPLDSASTVYLLPFLILVTLLLFLVGFSLTFSSLAVTSTSLPIWLVGFISFTYSPLIQPIFPFTFILYQPLDSTSTVYLLPFLILVTLLLFLVGFSLTFNSLAVTSTSLPIWLVGFISFTYSPLIQPIFPFTFILYQPLDSTSTVYLLPFLI